MAEAITVRGAPSYARLIAQAARRRRLLEASQAAVKAMSNGFVKNPTEYAVSMIKTLDEVASAGLSDNACRVTLGQGVASVLALANQTRLGQGILGTSYVIPKLNAATLGMRPRQFIVLAGRPAMGKTSTAMYIALTAAHRSGAVGLIPLEMTAEELSERVLSAIAYNPREWSTNSYRAITEARGLAEAAMARLREAKKACAVIPLGIEQQPDLHLSQISARARQIKLKAKRQQISFPALTRNS